MRARAASIVGWTGLGFLAVAVAVGVLAGPSALMELSPRCMIRELSGLECPTCGMTRSLAALCQGDLAGMLHHNAASPLILLATVWGLVKLVRIPRAPRSPSSVIGPTKRLRAMVSGLIESSEEAAPEGAAEYA